MVLASRLLTCWHIWLKHSPNSYFGLVFLVLTGLNISLAALLLVIVPRGCQTVSQTKTQAIIKP